mmetsp:Transcript_4463/g.13422  ORF Transcript_4463/g.13422 Transcript_4463/m.13422 type:complete len:253 (-) Transcript_4463:1040-1798(-)
MTRSPPKGAAGAWRQPDWRPWRWRRWRLSPSSLWPVGARRHLALAVPSGRTPQPSPTRREWPVAPGRCNGPATPASASKSEARAPTKDSFWSCGIATGRRLTSSSSGAQASPKSGWPRTLTCVSMWHITASNPANRSSSGIALTGTATSFSARQTTGVATSRSTRTPACALTSRGTFRPTAMGSRSGRVSTAQTKHLPPAFPRAQACRPRRRARVARRLKVGYHIITPSGRPVRGANGPGCKPTAMSIAGLA